jgi:hypothetical protein
MEGKGKKWEGKEGKGNEGAADGSSFEKSIVLVIITRLRLQAFELQ